EQYWGGAPEVHEVHFYEVPELASRINGMLAGEYDFATDIPTDQVQTVESSGKLEFVGGPILNHQITCFDKSHPVLKDPRVRLALSHAVDRQMIVDALCDGRTLVSKGLLYDYLGAVLGHSLSYPHY